MNRARRGQELGSRSPSKTESGFTLVELMVVVLIIGILVMIAIPVFQSMRARAEIRACFATQRTIQGAAAMWRVDTTLPISAIAGTVDSTSLLMNPLYLHTPPRCPAAVAPAGLYSIDASGSVMPCTFGNPVHGSFYGP